MKNLTSRSTRYIILLLSFICFTSCGYELRNPSSALSDIQFRIISENSELNKEFEKQIKQRNVIFQSDQAKSTITLKIKKHDLQRFVGSVGGGARTTQVRFEYKIVYEILSEGMKMPLLINYEDSSFVDFNQSDLLAFEEESDSVKESFVRKAIRNLEFKVVSISMKLSRSHLFNHLKESDLNRIYCFCADESIQITALSD